MKYKVSIVAIWGSIFLLLFPSLVYANSSWHWVTTSPMAVLPFAVVFTLLIETLFVVKLGKVADYKKAFIIIGLANFLSFLAPYFERAYRFIPTSGGFSLSAAFQKGPYYMILTGYLLLTVIVELPVVFLLLRKYCTNIKKLIIAIVLSNVLTTILVAVLERLLCVGRW